MKSKSIRLSFVIVSSGGTREWIAKCNASSVRELKGTKSLDSSGWFDPYCSKASAMLCLATCFWWWDFQGIAMVLGERLILQAIFQYYRRPSAAIGFCLVRLCVRILCLSPQVCVRFLSLDRCRRCERYRVRDADWPFRRWHERLTMPLNVMM